MRSKKLKSVRGLSCLSTAVAAGLGLAANQAPATTYTWNGATANWNVAGNWQAGVPANSVATDLVFTGQGVTTTSQNISANFHFGSLTFLSGASAFSIGGSSFELDTANMLITQSSGSAQSISNDFNHSNNNNERSLILGGNGTGTVTLSGIISDSTGQRKTRLQKDGGSTFELSNANTYDNGTTINGGVLRIANANALGTGAVVVNAGTLEIRNVALLATNLTLNNGATLLGSGGANASYSKSSNPVIDSGATVTLATSASTDALTLGSGAANTGTLTPTINISNPTGGAVRLDSGSNSFRGNWVLQSGTLRLSADNSLGNGTASGTFTGSTLGITGTSTLLVRSSSARTFNGGGANVPVTVSGAGTITTFAQESASATNGVTHTFGNLDIGSQQLRVQAGTNINMNTTFGLTFGATTLSGDPTFNVLSNGTAAGTLTLGALTDGGIARTITKTGTGSLTLGNNATSLVSGTVLNVDAGTVNLGSPGALGTLSSVTIATGATLGIGANQTLAALDSAPAAAGTVTLGNNTLTVGGAGNLSSTFNGIISGSTGALTKAGNGTLTLGGSSSNAYTGLTTVSAGVLAMNKTSGMNAVGANLSANGGTARYLASDQVANTATIAVSGAGVLDLQANTDTVAGVSMNGGSIIGAGTLTSTGTVAIAGTGNAIGANVVGNVSLSGAATLALTGTITGNVAANAGTLSGSGTINGSTSFLGNGGVNGSGLTFNGPVSFTGNGHNLMGVVNVPSGLSVSSTGALSIGGTVTGSVSVSGKLKGTGTVGPVTINAGGIIAPGNSPGTLNTGSETWNAAGNYQWEINDTTLVLKGQNPGYDFLSIAGTLDLTGIAGGAGNQFTITADSMGASVANFNPSSNYTWTIATASLGISGFAANKFNIVNNFVGASGPFSISINDTGGADDLLLSYTGVPIPEPTSLGLAACAMLGLFPGRRRRRA